MTTTCFRQFLRLELARRRTRNQRYSLRAFAGSLAVDHSTVSQWLRGRRPVTPRAIEKLGPTLGLTKKQVRMFIEHRAAPADHHTDLDLLALTRRDGFRADSRWIAGELRVSVDEANIALQRLLRLDLLEMVAVNQWIDTSEVG